MSIRTGIYVRVSTDDQKENGFSIDSQLRMLKEYCEKNNYDIIGVYDDGGYSGKTLMRPAMQKLLKDIKDHKLDRLVAVKTDRLSRSNLDGFWLLNYCEENDVKIELNNFGCVRVSLIYLHLTIWLFLFFKILKAIISTLFIIIWYFFIDF